MAVLVETDTSEIASLIESLGPLPTHETIRSPEQGLVMIQGRIGGDGRAFNLGEASVTRAAVRLESGPIGFAFVLGRDGDKARLVALCDALVQDAAFTDAVRERVVEPLRARLDARRALVAARTAATRVDFHTLVRGEA